MLYVPVMIMLQKCSCLTLGTAIAGTMWTDGPRRPVKFGLLLCIQTSNKISQQLHLKQLNTCIFFVAIDIKMNVF